MSAQAKNAYAVESQHFRPSLEHLEQREAPAAITLPDFYTVRSGQFLNQTGANGNGVAGVLRNDYDSVQGAPPPYRNSGMTAKLLRAPFSAATGLPIATPFAFASDGGFTFRAPRNFAGTVQFTYQAKSQDGSVSAATLATIDVLAPVRRVAVGADEGGAPAVSVYDAAANTNLFNFNAFDPSFQGGVRVATGDFNGDNVDDIVCAAGPGAGPHVKVFDGKSGAQIASFYAFAPGFAGGLTVSTGDLNGDGVDDLIVSAGSGRDAHIKVFDGTKLAQPGFDPDNPANLLASFYAYGAGETGGVRTAVGDIDGDGKNKLVVAPAHGGTGSGTLVKAFDIAGGTPVQTKAFFAGNPSDNRGLYVAVGDFNGDNYDDIAVGSGSGRPEARIYVRTPSDPTTMVLERSLTAAGYSDSFASDAFTTPFNTNPDPNYLGDTLAPPANAPVSFVGGPAPVKPGFLQGYTGGMRVAADYANGDNFADLVLGQGPNGYPRVLILSGQDLAPLADFSVFPGFFGGLNVAGHF